MKLTRLALGTLAVFAGRGYLGAALVLTLAAAANASHPVQYTGMGTDHMGGAVAFGDVNGDGIPDIVVGADGGD
jgi:hypothetical protein